MSHIVAGLFNDSKKAGHAVAELKQVGFTDDISLIAKDPSDTEASAHQIKQKVTDGAGDGAAVGGMLGGLVGLLAGIGTVILPGLGTLIVAGPLAALWGITGAAAGALTGGLVGALVDAGIPEERAKQFEDAIRRGEVLVTVTADHEDEQEVRRILDKHNVRESATSHMSA
jgi:uncharacterized membrane protein